MNYSEAVDNCYGQGGHLARIDSEEMNILIADFAEQSDRNVHMKELLWLDYSFKDDSWYDRRGNRPEYIGFENETLLEFTRVYEDWQDCALINYKSLGRWINEFCNARFLFDNFIKIFSVLVFYNSNFSDINQHVKQGGVKLKAHASPYQRNLEIRLLFYMTTSYMMTELLKNLLSAQGIFKLFKIIKNKF